MPQALPSCRRWIRGGLLRSALYAALALVVTSPLVWSPLSAIPTLPERSAVVPLFNLWTIWWNVDRLGHAWHGYWQAPIFHPATDAFAFSEPQPLTALLAPLLWTTGSRILAYNVFLWLSLVLNAMFAERLLRRVGIGRSPAFLGGAIVLALPIVLWQIDVVQLVPVWGILWSWSALHRLPSDPTLRRGMEWGAAVGVTCLLCLNHGLFHLLLLVPSGWILVGGRGGMRTVLPIAAGLLVVIVLVAPVAIPLRQAAARHGFHRDPETILALSARSGDYFGTSDRAWVQFHRAAARDGWELSPGWLKVGGAVLGMAWGLRRRRLRRWTVFLTAVAATGYLFSLGSHWRLGAWEPWGLLTQVVPGLSQIRNVFRFAYFVQIAVALLAVQSLQGVASLVGRCASPTVALGATLLIGTAFMFEVPSPAMELVNLPPAPVHQGWIRFLERETPPGKGIVCLPLPLDNRVADFEDTARWMYFGTFHGVPLVNGYSGFFPAEDFLRREILHRQFPNEFTLQLLDGLLTEFVVARRTSFPTAIAGTYGEMTLQHIFRDDEAGVDVYRIARRPTRTDRSDD